MMEAFDIIGASLAFLATIFYIRINVWAWPIGLIAIGIDMFLYGYKGIYGDMALNSIYLLMTLYGWYQWKFGGNNHTELPVTSMDWKLTAILSLMAVFGISITYFILSHYTNSQIPVLDATTTILSLIAQWLICRKILQCWALWFVIDAMYSGLYFYKGIPAHGILNIIYLGMAVAGYWRWRQQLTQELVSDAA